MGRTSEGMEGGGGELNGVGKDAASDANSASGNPFLSLRCVNVIRPILSVY